MQPNKENSGSMKPVYSNGANTNLNRIETDEGKVGMCKIIQWMSSAH